MAKKESTFGNMVIALLVVTLLSATTLGFVYEFTKAPIEQAKLNKKLNAIKQVVPEFTNNPDAEKFQLEIPGEEPVMAYPAKKDGTLVGTAIESYTMMGFSGLIKLMVGLKPDGSIHSVSVLEHKETPGLGTHMSDEWYINQYKGKDPATNNIQVTKDGGEIDAITAATISSRAFSDAVMRAYKAYMSQATEVQTDTTLQTANTGGEL